MTPASVRILATVRADLDRLDVPRDTGGKGNLTPGAHGAVFGHEQASPARHPFQRAEDAASPAKLSVRLHLDGVAHPGKLTGFRNYGFVRIQRALKNRHGSPDDTALHGRLLLEVMGKPV